MQQRIKQAKQFWQWKSFKGESCCISFFKLLILAQMYCFMSSFLFYHSIFMKLSASDVSASVLLWNTMLSLFFFLCDLLKIQISSKLTNICFLLWMQTTFAFPILSNSFTLKIKQRCFILSMRRIENVKMVLQFEVGEYHATMRTYQRMRKMLQISRRSLRKELI